MRQNILLGALSALAVTVVADFPLDPNVVDPTLRNQWCQAEQNTCELLCSFSTSKNDCDPETLAYDCKCSDGKEPPLDEYTQTMPTFICEKAFEVCNLANVGSQQGQKNCTTTIKDNCGTLDPTKADVGGGDSEASAAPSTSASATGTAATNAPGPTSTNAAMATNVAVFGNGIAAVAAGVLAAALL